MADLRRGFVTRCPDDHEVRPVFDVERLGASLARGRVQYFCFRCGRDIALAQTEHASLRAWLDRLAVSK